MNQAQGWEQRSALLLSIITVMFASYVILRVAAHGARWLNPLAIKLITRLMGLLLAAIAVQFAINGLEQAALFKK
jgi:multiple antibiotic resistance protein